MNKLFDEVGEIKSQVKTKSKKNLRINEDIILEYIKLMAEIPHVIDGYGLKHEYLIKQSKISRATFFRKLKDKNWDAQEALRLAQAINR